MGRDRLDLQRGDGRESGHFPIDLTSMGRFNGSDLQDGALQAAFCQVLCRAARM